jgi:excisionase family DNA binding protein
MADLPSELSSVLGVPERTFRRWCETGKMPGAYQTRGGHWRVRRPSPAMLRKVSGTGFWASERGRLVKALDLYFSIPRSPMRDKTIRAVLDDSFAEKILAADEIVSGFRAVAARDELDLDSYEMNLQRCKDLLKPDRRLKLSARKLFHETGVQVTPRMLARELNISVRTLYRRFDRDTVREACTLGGSGGFVPDAEDRLGAHIIAA